MVMLPDSLTLRWTSVEPYREVKDNGRRRSVEGVCGTTVSQIVVRQTLYRILRTVFKVGTQGLLVSAKCEASSAKTPPAVESNGWWGYIHCVTLITTVLCGRDIFPFCEYGTCAYKRSYRKGAE